MFGKRTQDFIPNADLGKSVQKTTEELKAAEAELRKRTANGVDIEDNQAHVRNLHDARASNN